MSKRRPPHLKVVSGTDRPDRPEAESPFFALERMPDAPTWLPNAHALNEWNRLGPVLLNLKLLTEANQMAFAHLCALQGKITQLWTAGETPTGYLIAQWRGLLNDFGLICVTSPSAARKVATEPEKQSRFERFKPSG